MRQVRVAYLIDRIHSDRAGTEKQLLETIRLLGDSPISPSLILLDHTEWSRSHPLPCQAFSMGYRGILRLSFPRIITRLSALIRKHEFDIIHSFFEDSMYVGYLASLLCAKKPILIGSRRDIGLGRGASLSNRLLRRFLPILMHRYDGIVVNATAIRESLVRYGVSPERIWLVRNGIDTTFAPQDPPPPLKERIQTLRIGIAANLSPVKRIDLFLSALALLRDTHGVRNFQGIVLGDGPERASLRDLAQRLDLTGWVHFAGAVDNVDAYLQHLDIAVLCSDLEGLSNSILEYMKHSLPVVATRVGGNPELVDSSNGFCVPPGDPKALAAALSALSRDSALRSALGEASRRKLCGEYSWERSLGSLQSCYTTLLGGSRREHISEPSLN